MSRWIKIGGLLALVAIGAAVVLVSSHWPFTRDKMVSALEQKFSCAVELKAFHGTYFTPGFVAEGVTFRRNGDRNAPPIATIEKLIIQGGYWGMFSTPKRIRLANIEGLRVFISPSSKHIGNEARPTDSLEKFALVIDEIIADDAVVEFASSEPGAEPLKFEIHKLALRSVADDRPLSFHVALLNPRPPGEIRADGQFGPLRPRNVGQTLLSGSYVFQRADLGIFPGIRGTLSSTGKFNGLLEHIEIEGRTDAPDFQIKSTEHAVHLKTQFQAIVNGMDGDVALQSLNAEFERTSVASQGEVAKKEGSDGKTVSLGATEAPGRIQDWLHLLSRADPPAMTGAMNFRVQVQVPPGKRDFIKRVNLRGDFGIDAASFSRAATQVKVDNLSQLAQGEKASENPVSVVENLKGHVVLKDAIATFSDLSFSVPEAFVRVHGTYGLLTGQVNFHGILQVDNKLSKGTKGVKSVVLKSVEPFLKKKNAGESVPIKIGGTFSQPSYGLDVVP
jgi:hypothetical protein